MTKHTRRVLELGVGLALALAIVLTVGADWHQRTAAQVRADTLRLHILANSDTLDDQLLKLQVRDAVLAALPPAVTEAATPDEAAAALQYALPALQQAAAGRVKSATPMLTPSSSRPTARVSSPATPRAWSRPRPAATTCISSSIRAITALPTSCSAMRTTSPRTTTSRT